MTITILLSTSSSCENISALQRNVFEIIAIYLRKLKVLHHKLHLHKQYQNYFQKLFRFLEPPIELQKLHTGHTDHNLKRGLDYYTFRNCRSSILRYTRKKPEYRSKSIIFNNMLSMYFTHFSFRF